MEVPVGFEPTNNGFAVRPLGPLGHGTPRKFQYTERRGGSVKFSSPASPENASLRESIAVSLKDAKKDSSL